MLMPTCALFAQNLSPKDRWRFINHATDKYYLNQMARIALSEKKGSKVLDRALLADWVRHPDASGAPMAIQQVGPAPTVRRMQACLRLCCSSDENVRTPPERFS